MKQYGIFQPFNLDWRLVAPRDFETLEFFLTPTLSILFRDIIATRVDQKQKGGAFRIGAYIMQDPNAHTKFLRDVLPQRSQERIETAFTDPNFSAFFTFEEGEGLRELFDQQGFICRHVEINVHGRPCALTELNQTDFRKIVDVFSAMCVLGMVHFEAIGENMKNMQDDMEEAAYRRAKEDMQNQKATTGPTKRKLWAKGALAAGMLAGSVALLEIGRRFLKKGGWKFWLIGGLCHVAGLALGILAKQTGSQVAQHMKVGMIHG